MKRRYIILTIFFATIFGCQKKLFKRVAVTGQLFDLSTQTALADQKVALYGDDASSAKNSGENTIELTTTFTRTDGSFKLSCNASKGNRYYLRVGARLQTVLVSGHNDFTVPDNSTKELGTIPVRN